MAPRRRAQHERLMITRDQRDLARRRTDFLLDGIGFSMTIPDLLANAYLQGLIDAAEAVAIKAQRAG